MNGSNVADQSSVPLGAPLYAAPYTDTVHTAEVTGLFKMPLTATGIDSMLLTIGGIVVSSIA